MSLKRSSSRSGKPITLEINKQKYHGDDLRNFFPDFELDPITREVFGDFDYSGFNVCFEDYDKKLIALEYLDFVNSLEKKSDPEVGILEGISSLSLAYSFIETGYVDEKISIKDFSISGHQEYLNLD